MRMKREREREEADDEWGHIYVVSDEEVDRPPKRAKSVNEETEKKNPGEEVPDLDRAPNEEDAPEEEAPEENRNEEMPDSDEEPEENPNEDTREEDETNSEDETGDGPGIEEPGSDEEPEKSDDEKSVPDDDHPHSEDLGSDFNDELNAPEQAPDAEESEPESEEDAHDVEYKPAEGSEVEEEEPIKVEVDDRIWVFCAAKIKTGKRKGMTCGLTPLADGDYVRYCWQHCEDAEDAEPKKYTKKYTEHDAYSCPRNNGHNCGGCWKPEYDDE